MKNEVQALFLKRYNGGSQIYSREKKKGTVWNLNEILGKLYSMVKVPPFPCSF